MNQTELENYISQNITSLKGVGIKTKLLLKKKKIEKISDLLWNIPQDFTDRSNMQTLDKLEIGKIATIKVKAVKYNFPRIRNLPSKVICEDSTGKIDIVFFNSREGYIKKILPINSFVIISGKVNHFKKKYQITNPKYIGALEQMEYLKKIIPKYALTDGISEKIYKNLIDQVLKNITNVNEWHDQDILKIIGNKSWPESVLHIHQNKKNDLNSNFYRRLAYDEILANFLVLSEVRKKVKKFKKQKKTFDNFLSEDLLKKFGFNLTQGQNQVVNEINNDLKSDYKMFRLLQGDVGSGKTIVAFIAAANVIRSGWQVTLMAPTEILAKQHYDLAKKLFNLKNISIGFLTGKTKISEKKKIYKDLANNNINFLIGTHSLFQKGVSFKNLGLAIIDEQHKFGVKQRIDLSNKGGKDCDILLMSATPIPRSLILAVYGDMDVSRILHKPENRKETLTISKPEEKIKEIVAFANKKIINGGQIFWVCPLIDESKKLDYAAAVKQHLYLSKIFKNKVGLIHGGLKKDQKDQVLNEFLNKKISILVSTTVVEVGVDFPNANLMVIENSNKFGLSQLHQLRGRVGRGIEQGTCILMYKKSLSENARKRISILKKSNNGFEIAEEDMKLRGFGDMLGYKQSGIKIFKLADPIHHEDLFLLAEENIKKIENNEKNFYKFNLLLKLFDKADIINQINLSKSILD